MRCVQLNYLLFLCVSVVTISSCDKDKPQSNPQQNLYNTAPKASAGTDIWQLVTTDSARLYGMVVDAEHNSNKYLWTQVAGPDCVIDKPTYLTTLVTNLIKGDYAFELTATDAGGLTSKDTVAVFVKEPAVATNGEIIFKDLEWTCPWYCTVQIGCLPCHVPANKKFKVYVKGTGNLWIEAVPFASWKEEKYAYGTEANELVIYTGAPDAKLAPDIKIVF